MEAGAPGVPPVSRVPATARNRVESFRAAPTHLRPPGVLSSLKDQYQPLSSSCLLH